MTPEQSVGTHHLWGGSLICEVSIKLHFKKTAETSVWAESSSWWGSALWQNSSPPAAVDWTWLPLRSTYFWRRRLSWRADTPRTCVSGTRRGCRHSICNTRARLWAAELLNNEDQHILQEGVWGVLKSRLTSVHLLQVLSLWLCPIWLNKKRVKMLDCWLNKKLWNFVFRSFLLPHK